MRTRLRHGCWPLLFGLCFAAGLSAQTGSQSGLRQTYTAAEAAFKRHQWDLAQQLFEQVLAEVYGERGRLLESENQFAAAVGDLEWAGKLRPRSKLLSFEVVPANEEIAIALQVAPGESLFKVWRIRLANSSPLGIECSYIPQRLCPDLLETFDPSTSLYQTLSERYGIQMVIADEVIEARLASAQEARLLRVPKGSPVFMFTRTCSRESGQPVEHVTSVYRADRYKITQRLTRLNRELLRWESEAGLQAAVGKPAAVHSPNP